MLLLVLILGMDQLLGIDLTLDLLLGLLLALHMAYMDHEGLGHAHERQNQALDHYSQLSESNLDLGRSNQFQKILSKQKRNCRCNVLRYHHPRHHNHHSWNYHLYLK